MLLGGHREAGGSDDRMGRGRRKMRRKKYYKLGNLADINP